MKMKRLLLEDTSITERATDRPTDRRARRDVGRSKRRLLGGLARAVRADLAESFAINERIANETSFKKQSSASCCLLRSSCSPLLPPPPLSSRARRRKRRGPVDANEASPSSRRLCVRTRRAAEKKTRSARAAAADGTRDSKNGFFSLSDFAVSVANPAVLRKSFRSKRAPEGRKRPRSFPTPPRRGRGATDPSSHTFLVRGVRVDFYPRRSDEWS